MCATCGCGDVHQHGEDHEHQLQHEHGHAHPHDHDHEHGHAHPHDHDHEHGHAHPHDHDHEHGHAHPHDHDHARDHAYRPDRGEPRQGAPRTVTLEADLLAKNNLLAARNRAWLERHDIAALNLMGAPGAGKTTLLERTVRELAPAARIAVIEGDQATEADALRIRAAGSDALQINTGAGCHLDAAMIEGALDQLAPRDSSLLFIENVGNLVCPAMFDLGEARRVVVSAVTEGEDKPLKYPHMFRAADVLVLTKIDLLEVLEMDLARCVEIARQVNPRLEVFALSARTGAGLAEWCRWLKLLPRARRGGVGPAVTTGDAAGTVVEP